MIKRFVLIGVVLMSVLSGCVNDGGSKSDKHYTADNMATCIKGHGGDQSAVKYCEYERDMYNDAIDSAVDYTCTGKVCTAK